MKKSVRTDLVHTLLGGAALAVLALAPAIATAAPKDTLLVTIAGDAATLDPHIQWDTDSYTVYRNIFDNLVTRNAKGDIVPQVGKSW